MLGTVLYFVEDRMVERIDLFLDDRRRLMSALDEAVPAGGHIVRMVLDDPAKPSMRLTAQSDRFIGHNARARERSDA